MDEQDTRTIIVGDEEEVEETTLFGRFADWIGNQVDFGESEPEEPDEQELYEEEEIAESPSALIAWLTYYKREVVFFASIAALFIAGYAQVTVRIFVNSGIGFIVLFLALNPFYIFERFLPPQSRICIITSIVLVVVSVQIAGLPRYFIGTSILISIILMGLMIYKNRDWLIDHGYQQHANCDTVMSHINTAKNGEPSNAGTFEAMTAWSKFGCARTRALLHQSLKLSVKEQFIRRVCKPVYQLGYLDGAQNSGFDATDRYKKKIRDLQYTITSLEVQVARSETIESEARATMDEVETHRRDAAALRMQCLRHEERERDLQMQIEELRAVNEQLTAEKNTVRELPVESIEEHGSGAENTQQSETDVTEAMWSYWAGGKQNGGHSLQEVADHFGTSKTTAQRKIKAFEQEKGA